MARIIRETLAGQNVATAAITSNIGAFERAKQTAMRLVANEIVFDIQKSLDTPFPPASAPGTPPHKRTGDLQRSIRAEVHNDRIDIRGIEYGSYLETGTGTMSPRPYIAPVLHERRGEWANKFAEIMGRILSKGLDAGYFDRGLGASRRR